MNWYIETKTDEGLSQGDIILDCPIIIPPSDINPHNWTDAEVELFDVIILSQSCDLQWDKLKFVLVAPLFSMDDFIRVNAHFKDVNLQNAMREGNLPGYHLLDKYAFNSRSDLKDQYLVVDFKSVFSVNFEFLKLFSKSSVESITLSSPYVEHLSQAFARFLMRVGLPSTIPKFKKKNK